MRRIVLELADDANATKCGSCAHRSGRDVCQIFGPLAFARRAARIPTRHLDCLAAEQRAERMLDVSQEAAK